MNEKELNILLKELVREPHETEWLEFKANFHSPEEIGERLSALSNGACLKNKKFGYLVFGVKDVTHQILGTAFKAKSHKKGKEDLEHWLLNRLRPRIDIEIFEFDTDNGEYISLYKIPAATNSPTEFTNISYIRIGSYTKKLGDYPLKASKLWKSFSKQAFEKEIALKNVTSADIIRLLDTPTYFELIKLPYPTTQERVIEKFESEKLVIKTTKGYDITNLGAILFAKKLNEFETLKRKAIRVIVYKDKNRIDTVREQMGQRGYAVGFVGLINWINSQLPANEEIGKALRKETKMYPEIAIREVVANALIHQDFNEKGFPAIEIFSDRVEITNTGLPIIPTDRFIDEYQSRNEQLADIMRRMGICEEKGSGFDKVIFSNELYQLPAVNILKQELHTKVILYSYMPLNKMDKKDKIRACYQHACLKRVSNETMTNETLRTRFKIDDKNSAIASRIIKETFDAGFIKKGDPTSKSRKHIKYIPFWA